MSEYPLPSDEGGLRPPPGLSSWRRAWWWFHFLILVKLARLRFIAILVAIGAVIVYWETLHSYYEKWTRPLFGEEQIVRTDIEFWCPMHPTVVRDHADKCPICAMPLSKRRKGQQDQDAALPPGILSRVQLTPYRVAQAGLQTAEVTYLPLAREIKTVGFVEFDEEKLARISARVTGKSRIDKLFVNVTGQMISQGDPLALLYSPDLVTTVQNLLDARSMGNKELERITRGRLDLWGIDKDQVDEILKTGKPIMHVTLRSPISGHVIRKYQFEGEYIEEGARLYDIADLSAVWIEAQLYEDELAFARLGMPVSATTSAFPGRKFSGKVAFVHPHLDWASRTLRMRFDIPNPEHELRPGMFASVSLTVPANELPLLARLANDVAAPQTDPQATKEAQERLTRQRALFKRGLVLAVPERAVIDTGSRKIVYRQHLLHEYEGVLVELGPRMTGPDQALYYPVLSGLAPGDQVVTTGSFLIDAETRLTAGAGSTYFGATGGPAGADQRTAITAEAALVEDEEAKVKAALGKLSTPDRRLAESQEYCPILADNRLGSMGVPVKVLVKGQPVFLCCKGCKEKALEAADETLLKVQRLKAQPGSVTKQEQGSQVSGLPALSPKEAAEVQKSLAKLSPEDRRIAEAQLLCPIVEKSYLGSMGAPVKVMIQGQAVFLCCEACEEKALANGSQTLQKAAKLKARTKSK